MAKQHKPQNHGELVLSLGAVDFTLSTSLAGNGMQFSDAESPIAPAGVVSTPIGECVVRTMSCQFSKGWEHRSGGKEQEPCNSDRLARNPRIPAPRCTRIRPPRDLVKLEDRLRLLLQPPLESLLAARSLRFARPPFGFQLDGIAFLYPRQEAVLADEMGLGKTMQAITAIRLLGPSRATCAACCWFAPSRWSRIGSASLPLGAGADRDRRSKAGPRDANGCGVKRSDVVTIANYETVVRDRDDVCDPANHFDLVVLDESQRIKNAASTTNEVVRSIPRSRSWALTGTPIENSVEDLVGIFEFVVAGSVGREDEAAGHRPGRFRLRAAPHEGPGAHRPAAQIVSRRGRRADARAGRVVPACRRRRRRIASAK